MQLKERGKRSADISVRRQQSAEGYADSTRQDKNVLSPQKRQDAASTMEQTGRFDHKTAASVDFALPEGWVPVATYAGREDAQEAGLAVLAMGHAYWLLPSRGNSCSACRRAVLRPSRSNWTRWRIWAVGEGGRHRSGCMNLPRVEARFSAIP